MANERILYTAADVTDEILADAEAVWEGWFADSARIDWDEFVDRLVVGQQYDIEDMASPAVNKIQRHVRGLAQQ